MPDLYVTPKGRWTGTKAEAAKATRAEGSPPGSWKSVPVPTKKGPLLDFLNKGWKAPEPAPTVEIGTDRPGWKMKTPEGWRWRVYVRGQFAAVVHADTREEAVATAIANLTVRAQKPPVR